MVFARTWLFPKKINFINKKSYSYEMHSRKLSLGWYFFERYTYQYLFTFKVLICTLYEPCCGKYGSNVYLLKGYHPVDRFCTVLFSENVH